MIEKELKRKYQEKDVSLFGEKNIENSLALLYHENSKLSFLGMRALSERIGRFSIPFIINRSIQPYKIYPGAERIDLNQYMFNLEKPIGRCLLERTSTRDYDSSYKLSTNELAQLLLGAYGETRRVKSVVNGEIQEHGFRTAPSAGALYGLEIYIVALHTHIKEGIYHYCVKENSLELLKEGNFITDLETFIQAEPFVHIRDACAVMLISGIPERFMIKYGERGYRFLIMESGIVAQSVSLILEAMNLSSCILGGFHDDKLNGLLGIDGTFESVNNVISIGKRKNG